MVSLRYVGSLVASVMFGLAILPSWGGYSDPAVTWVILGLIVVGFLFSTTRKEEARAIPPRFIAPAIWGVLAGLASAPAWFPQPLLYLSGDWSAGQAARWAIAALIATYGVGLWRAEAPWLRNTRFVAMALLVVVLGVGTIKASPAPLIDVWTVQQEGASVFLQGKNPFQEVHLADTGPRTATDVPYVYPPLQLYVSAVAWGLLGDIRYAAVLALALLGFAARTLAQKVRGARDLPSILEDAPALLIWCTPMLPFIIEQGWIDPVQVCWCSALFLAWGRRWPMAVLAGLVLGAKQTMMFMVLPVGLAARLSLRQWLVVGLVGLLPLVPWLLWDLSAYKHANFDFLNALPVREDALTVVTWAKRRLHLTIPWAVGFISAALVIAVAAWGGKQSLERAAITALMAMTLLFTFNKWAFANYYFTLLSLAALAAAASLAKPLSPAAPAPFGPRSGDEADDAIKEDVVRARPSEDVPAAQ